MPSDFQNEQEPEPEEPQLTPEEYLDARKSSIRTKSYWALGIGGFLVLVHFFWVVVLNASLDILFENILFIVGCIVLLGGIWGIFESRRLSLADLIPSQEAIEFARSSPTVQPYFTLVMCAAFVVIFLCQVMYATSDGELGGLQEAALLKPDTWEKREYWRILTSALLHGGFLHIYFNTQATYGLGTLIEYLSNRMHVPIIFVLSAIIGGGLSCLLMPGFGASVGASGGLMGMIGYLAVYAYRRRRQLQPGFLRSILTNIALIGAIGLVGYKFIDNAAHLGGLLTGVTYGLIQIPRDLGADPRKANLFIQILGYVSFWVLIVAALLTLSLITGFIVL